MNILLTGGAGYIGSHTAVVLTQAGHHVVLFDNLSNSNATVLESVSTIVGKHLPFVYGDVRDTALVGKTLREHRIDAAIHFAGLKAVGESVELPVEYYANNVQGTLSLLQAMQAESVNTLLFSSSATVYGVPQYLPLDEFHPTGATNPYGKTKLHVEEILRDVAASNPAWHIVCLRYFNPVGAHSSGIIGESPLGMPNNLMPFIAQVAAGQRDQLQVFGDDYPTPDGTGVRDYIHVMDLAEGHAAALSYMRDRSGLDVINLGTGRGYSVFEMVRSFEKASGRVIPYAIASRRPGDVPECYANPEKAQRLLGWQAVRSLEDMCASVWQFQQMTSEGLDRHE
jgi:UDP-glucose 4-epimerase